MPVTVHSQRGWDVVRISSDVFAIDVLPEKGGDILAATWLPLELNLLWSTPWGLRAKGSVGNGGTSFVSFLENYPGGWQTLFPNGGTETEEQGVALPFHGEATSIPWDWEQVDETTVVLTTHLMRSPFTLRREISVDGGRVTVTERIRNVSQVPQPAMWSHHPAFGAPFLDETCRLETGARRFLADSGYDTPNTDLAAGEASSWPLAQGKVDGTVDLREVPGKDAFVDRFGYLLDFDEPWYSLTNPGLGLTATVRWDGERFPYAWFWCEAQGSAGFPWHQRAYVLAVEPATSHPGSGLAVARDETKTAVWFEPGEELTGHVVLEVGPS